MSSWIEGRRMAPKVGAGPREVDRDLAHPHVFAARVRDTCEVTWEFPDGTPATYPESWEWEVERSGSPGGPFQVVSPRLPSSEKLWRDDDIPQGRENTRRPYYRLVFYLDGEPRTYGYRPEWDTIAPGGEHHGFTWEEGGVRSAYCPPVVRESRRRFSILSRNYSRTMTALYREAWLEGPCDQCVDPLTGERQGGTDGSRCKTCYGTGYYGGYYTPLRFEVMRNDSGMLRPQEIPQGVHDLEEQGQLVCPFWPIPEPRDIIRHHDGSLYVVEGVASQDAWGYPIVHIMSVSQIPRTHVINDLPVPTALFDASSGPRRQHGRAMNLDTYRESLSGGAMARTGALPQEVPDYSEGDT